MKKILTYENAKVGMLVHWQGEPVEIIDPIFGIITEIEEVWEWVAPDEPFDEDYWGWSIYVLDKSGEHIKLWMTADMTVYIVEVENG